MLCYSTRNIISEIANKNSKCGISKTEKNNKTTWQRGLKSNHLCRNKGNVPTNVFLNTPNYSLLIKTTGPHEIM